MQALLMSEPEAADAEGLQDVLPILKRTADSIWAQVEAKRDELFAVLRSVSTQEGYDALVIKSGPFVQPAWVKIECWIPREDGKASGRAWAVISIHAKEFHRHTMEYGVDVENRGWSKSYDRLVGFQEDHVARLARFVLGRGSAPRLAPLRVRSRQWQFWRPLNKLDVLATDWMQFAPMILFVLGVILLVPLAPLGLLLLIGGFAALVALQRRRAHVLSSGKPRAEPRSLHRVDSWQVVVSGLGGQAGTLRSRLLDLMVTPPMEGFESHVEKIWD